MDRFVDEQENPVPARDRSCSPNIHSLLYRDPKRHSHELRSPAEPVASEAEIVAAIELVKEVVPDWNHRLDFSPVKLHPEIDSSTPITASATTVAVNTETQASQSPQNLVYSANFTPVAPAPVDQRAEGTVAKVVQPAAVPGTVDSARLPSGSDCHGNDLKHNINTSEAKESEDSDEPCRKRLRMEQSDTIAENCVGSSSTVMTSSSSVEIADSAPTSATVSTTTCTPPTAGIPDSATHSVEGNAVPAAPSSPVKASINDSVSSSTGCVKSVASHPGQQPSVVTTANASSPTSCLPCPGPDSSTVQNCGSPPPPPSKAGGVALAIASVNSTAVHGLGDASIAAALSAEVSKSPPLATAEPLAQ